MTLFDPENSFVARYPYFRCFQLLNIVKCGFEKVDVAGKAWPKAETSFSVCPLNNAAQKNILRIWRKNLSDLTHVVKSLCKLE